MGEGSGGTVSSLERRSPRYVEGRMARDGLIGSDELDSVGLGIVPGPTSSVSCGTGDPAKVRQAGQGPLARSVAVGDSTPACRWVESKGEKKTTIVARLVSVDIISEWLRGEPRRDRLHILKQMAKINKCPSVNG